MARNAVVWSGDLWYRGALGCRDVNKESSGGAGRTDVGPPSSIPKANMRMKKRDHSGSKKGGEKGTGKRRSTAAQRRSYERLAQSSRGWNELMEDQRIAWRHAARDTRSRTRRGLSYPLDGQKLFNKINAVMALLGREPRTNPPPQPRFGANPVGSLHVTGVGEGISLRLSVSGTPAEEIMVFASPPYKAGRTYCGDYRFIGLLPVPVEGMSDITRLYIKKFGVPPPNTRVFIRAWQEVNGWECRAGMRLTNALVPPRGGAADSQKRGRAVGKKA